jgi:hypothetical protein
LIEVQCRTDATSPGAKAVALLNGSFQVNLELAGRIFPERFWEVLQVTLKKYEKL